MKIIQRYRNRISLLILVLGFTCCNVEFKASHISLNINESKKRKVYICGYEVCKKNFRDSIDFNFNEIWMEKQWSNHLDKNSQEILEVMDSTAQLVFNFRDERLFSKKIYWDKYIIKDAQGNVLGSDKGLLFLDADTLVNTPAFIRLFVIKVDHKFQTNLDTIRIGEIVLRRQ